MLKDVLIRIIGVLPVAGCQTALELWSARLDNSQLISVLHRLAARRVDRLAPADALRFLMHLDGLLYKIQGRQAVRYDGGLHVKHRLMGYHDFFVERVRAGERVFDVGCGNGALTHDMAQRAGCQVVGIDLSAENIALARREHAHPQVEYRIGDATTLKSEPGQCDVVTLSNVLEHLPDRPAFLRRLVQQVAPARLLIRVPLFERDWRVPLKRELGVEWRLDATHETEYTLESFLEEMEAAGLSVTHQEVRWGEIWAEVRP